MAVDQLWVPNHIAERIQTHKRMVALAKHRVLMERDPAYREDYERKQRDTKPIMYVDTTTRGRPVIIAGGRGMWYLDAKDLAQRLKEKPDPAKDPEVAGKRNFRADMSTAIDRRLRAMKNARTFHIKSNPCYKEAI